MANDPTALALAALSRILPAPPASAGSAATLADGSFLFQLHVDDPQSLSIASIRLAEVRDLDLTASMSADGAQIDADIEAQMNLLNGAVSLSVIGRFSEQYIEGQRSSQLRLDAVARAPVSITGLLAPLGVHLPSAFDVLSVRDLKLTIERGGWSSWSEGVESHTSEVKVLASGKLGGTGSWEVIPGLLTLTAPAVAIGHQGGRTWVDVAETLELFGAWWRVSVQLPIGVGSASLRSEITMEALVEHFGLHDPTGTLSSLTITEASLAFDHPVGRLGIELEVSTTWVLGPLALQSIRFALIHDAAGVAGGLSARAALGGAQFEIRASHPGPGLGWTIDGYADLRDSPLKLNDLLAALEHDAAGVGGLSDANLTGIGLSHATLTGETRLDVYGAWGADPIELHLSRQAGAGFTFRGQWIHQGALMSLAVQSGVVVAAYSGAGNGKLSLASLMEKDGGGLDLTVSAALVARKAADPLVPGDTAKVLLAAEIGVEIGVDALKKVPVLGERLGPDASFGLSLHALYSAGSDHIRGAVDSLVPVGLPALPTPFPEGLGGSRVDVRIGTRTIPLDGFTPRLQSAGTQTLPPNAPPTPVHENLGGVVGLRSVRPSVDGNTLHLAVDGAVRFGPLTLDVLGLDIGWDFKDSVPTVPSLRGFSLHLDKPPLAVTGAFLHLDDDFVGKAEIRTSKFALTALGGFTLVGGSPSLFLYGLLLEPLGGPPFFFVEGLAVGFGLNRRIRTPTLDEVETFPLVVDAMAPPGGVQGGDQLEKLHEYIAPKLGSGFLAVGVKFTSFRLIHGFVLAIVSIDTITGDFEITVVGTGEWVSPPEAPVGARMAYVRLDILAKMSSKDSSLLVQAKLGEGCFVINPLCHISGGMALATWYGGEHAGDFVLTVGGYHPDFKPPAHYPVPQRLTLDYRIGGGLHATGSMYFALTPNNLMFGFAFNAVWSTGPVSAWFDLTLDFLMKFKPVHYDATGHLEIGASVDAWLFTVHVSAGADLHIWGPDFGGHASVHLGPFHGDLSFGTAVAPPPPLNSAEFKTSFLPAKDEDVLSIQPAGGLRSTVSQGAEAAGGPKRWIFNPKEFALDLGALVPLEEEITIPPMSAEHAPVSALYRLDRRVERKTDGAYEVVEDTGITPSVVDPDTLKLDQSRRFPPALWKKGDGAEARLKYGIRLAAKPILPSTDPAFTRYALCATGDLAAPISRAPAWSAEAHASRSATDRLADRTSYAAELSSPNRARDAMLTSLSRVLGDAALAPERNNWRVDADALLDPPLPSPPP